MSDLEAGFADFLGQPTFGEVTEGFSGEAGARAALQASAIQAGLGRESLDVTRQAQQRLEETLAPFVGVGSTDTSLFGPDAVGQISNDPAFQAALERQQTQFLAQQAAGGRLATGETAGGLSNLTSQLGADFLSRQRGDQLSSLQLGQSSAAQQASAGLQSGARSSDILTQIGNAMAAGGIGAGQARTQGAQNTAGMAVALASLFASERRFKRNIKLTGIRPDGVKIYTYQYEWSDKIYTGAMVDENPHAVIDCGSYLALDYSRL
jgi:hypothetical protein